ncbi:hypothetical protein PHMEG_00018172 [Phytophthora megakarya]|uniref:Uncharacterized protein n=1 Tax=Phytophthora megakarya TaxID=4795 RepID=A0A225VUP3_9STRA|nr:hypothetical protein PHMEG_00018172 [Phytophthora megakarya]
MSSNSIFDLLDDVLDTYVIDPFQLCFFVCDHASVDVTLVRKARVPMIGWVLHRFNLAMRATLREHSDVLGKVHLLITKNEHQHESFGRRQKVVFLK